MPGSSLCRYSPVPGASVALCCVTRYCCGDNFAIASASLLNFRIVLLLGWAYLLRYRQLADAPAGRGENRVGQRGHETRRARFADSPGRLAALHELDGDARRLVDAQHPVVAEVGLLD